MSVMRPCLAGISKELTTPSNATMTKIGHGLGNPLNAMSAIRSIEESSYERGQYQQSIAGKSIGDGATDWRGDQAWSGSSREGRGR